MSLLTIVQRTCRALGLPRPTSVVSSNDDQVQQMFELANEEGEQLSRVYDWQALRVEKTFTTTATAAQSTALPTDLQRFVRGTFFNRTTREQLKGPITPQQWQAIQSQPALASVWLAFVERGGSFLITPTPSAGDTIAYEYVSTNWCQSAAAVAQSDFAADTDIALVSERLIRLGVRWRFLAAKGLAYAEAMRTYEAERDMLIARDGGNTAISITPDYQYPVLGTNIPEGNFGL